MPYYKRIRQIFFASFVSFFLFGTFAMAYSPSDNIGIETTEKLSDERSDPERSDAQSDELKLLFANQYLPFSTSSHSNDLFHDTFEVNSLFVTKRHFKPPRSSTSY